MVGLSHAENVTRCASRRVADDDEAAGQQPVANDAGFAVASARVLDFHRGAFEDDYCVFEIQASISQRACTLGGVEGDAHRLL